MENGSLKKLIYKFFLVIFVIGIFFATLKIAETLTSKQATPSNKAYPHWVESGDVIFRRGKGFWSLFFAQSNAETGFSHVGVIEKINDTFFVLHSDADELTLQGGVHRTDLDSFINESEFFEVKKNWMAAETKTKFLNVLRKYLVLQVPFDSEFTLEDNGSKMYCTEYLWISAKEAGIKDFGYVINLACFLVITVDSIYMSLFLQAQR